MRIAVQDILDVLDEAKLGLPVGMSANEAAVGWCVEHGLIERSYRGPMALLGLSHMRLADWVQP